MKAALSCSRGVARFCTAGVTEQPSEDEPVPEGLIALIGSIQGPADLAERHDDYLRERMERRFGNAERSTRQ